MAKCPTAAVRRGPIPEPEADETQAAPRAACATGAQLPPRFDTCAPYARVGAEQATLAQADQWLSQQVPKILALPEFQSGGDGLLFIVWDEGTHTDDRCSASKLTGCGGRIANLVIGPKVKRGYKSQVLYHHQSLMRTVCDAFTFNTCPGAAASAPSMTDVF